MSVSYKRVPGGYGVREYKLACDEPGCDASFQGDNTVLGTRASAARVGWSISIRARARGPRDFCSMHGTRGAS